MTPIECFVGGVACTVVVWESVRFGLWIFNKSKERKGGK